MKNITLLLVITVALAGCAQSSGVNKLGPDTYTVSVHAAPARGGQSGARGIAFEAAEKKCAEMGQEILVESFSTRASSHLPGGTAELVFHCFDRNNPNLGTPSYLESKPDVIIENRQR